MKENETQKIKMDEKRNNTTLKKTSKGKRNPKYQNRWKDEDNLLETQRVEGKRDKP